MRPKTKRGLTLALVIGVIGTFGILRLPGQNPAVPVPVAAPTPAPVVFDRSAALSALREQIKGRENEPAEKVFKNMKMLGSVPAGRILSIMEMGYSRSLGVDCTHCHVPGKWESEDKPQKQVAREMAAMVSAINSQMLTKIPNLQSTAPIVNCTTCHRGQVKPALNMPIVQGTKQ